MYYDKIKDKVFKTIKKYNLIKKEDKVLIALSGGKDSSILTLILRDYFLEKLKKPLKGNLLALHVDVGIKANEIQKKRAENLAKKYGIPFLVIKAPLKIDKIFNLKKGNVCNICGIQRRYFYIKVALEKGYNTIATGHNLNDEAETFIMNILQNNWLAATSNYIIKKSENLPKKIKPLYFVSNEETKKAAEELGIIEKKLENNKLCLCDCPYSRLSFRYFVRNFLNEAQKWDKSILNKIINFQLKFYEEINKKDDSLSENINRNKTCKICGMPSNREICKMCELKEKFKELFF